MAVGWSGTRELAALRQTVSLRQVASSASPSACVAPGGWRTSNKYAREVADRSLPERQLRKGIVSDGGDTSRSRRFLAKLLRGEAVTVVAIGGSITWSLCVSWHVPPDADLVIAEYNINDGPGKADEIRQAHERLLRKLLVYPNRPAVIELLYYRRPNNFTHCRVFLLAAVPNPRPEHKWEAWTNGQDHPNDVGHGYLADMVSTFLTQIMDDLDRHPLEAADDVAAAAELVPPMYRVCFPHFQKPKQGWVATAPGSVLEFDVATDITPGNESFIGSASVAAAIVYLSSYEHMGQAEVSCVEGCTCQSKTLNGHMTGLGTQQSIMLVELSLAARCRLRVMVLPDTSSGEHKVKVTGIIVSETSGWLIRDDVEVQPFRMFES
ncbi:hypothetical protein ACK3TF_003052 [Chlorella vulgaris]